MKSKTLKRFVVVALACGGLTCATPTMAQDKDYQADAQRVELPVGHPIEGGKLAEMMRALAAATTPDVIAAFQKLAAGK